MRRLELVGACGPEVLCSSNELKWSDRDFISENPWTGRTMAKEIKCAYAGPTLFCYNTSRARYDLDKKSIRAEFERSIFRPTEYWGATDEFVVGGSVCGKSQTDWMCWPIQGNQDRLRWQFPLAGLKQVANSGRHACFLYADRAECLVLPNSEGNTGQNDIPAGLPPLEALYVNETVTCGQSAIGLHCWGAWRMED